MEIYRESDMRQIKNKMTEIRRKKAAPIMHNYYMNCEHDTEIFALYGEASVVFWDDDNGVRRVYFYSDNPDELVKLLSQAPDGSIIDYLTYKKGELHDLIESAGWEQRYEMHRMSAAHITPEERAEIEERKRLFDTTLYMKDYVRPAVEEDCEAIYKKLYEVFDERESHLCTKEELMEFIRNRWVAVYYESGELLGFHIFTVENNTYYGYQIWNGVGPEGYYSLTKTTDQLFAEYVKDVPQEKVKPSYCWVNIKNRKSKRLIEFWGQKFDGLYDFVYEKLPAVKETT